MHKYILHFIDDENKLNSAVYYYECNATQVQSLNLRGK